MLGTFINQLLSADADQVCGAAYGTISDNRINRRNGYRHRDFAISETCDLDSPVIPSVLTRSSIRRVDTPRR